jgi:hypothetical protein
VGLALRNAVEFSPCVITCLTLRGGSSWRGLHDEHEQSAQRDDLVARVRRWSIDSVSIAGRLDPSLA